MAQALRAQAQRHGPPQFFGATDIVADIRGLLVAGVVDAGSHSWGAVLQIAHDLQLRSLPGEVPDGVWILQRDPSGRLWAGGEGAYVHDGRRWVQSWSYPSRHVAAR